jgi:hypothetical protein
MLRVNLLEAGFSAGRASKEGYLTVVGVGGNEGTKSFNEDGVVGMLRVDKSEGRVSKIAGYESEGRASKIAGVSVGEHCGLPT